MMNVPVKTKDVISHSLASGSVVLKSASGYTHTNKWSSFLDVSNLTMGTLEGIENLNGQSFTSLKPMKRLKH